MKKLTALLTTVVLMACVIAFAGCSSGSPQQTTEPLEKWGALLPDFKIPAFRAITQLEEYINDEVDRETALENITRTYDEMGEASDKVDYVGLASGEYINVETFTLKAREELKKDEPSKEFLEKYLEGIKEKMERYY